LTVGVVGLVAEDAQVRKAGYGSEATVGYLLGPPLLGLRLELRPAFLFRTA
jgi:hypothetical protein